MKPKDFQEATATRILEIFKENKQKRVLLADEVGLGKTIIASAVVSKVSEWHKTDLKDDHFKVVYICSNINIANQNAKKLGIKDEDCLKISQSRLSMQHLKIYAMEGDDHSYQQLIPMTPATSFSMTGGCGTQEERALMYAHLKRQERFKSLKKLSKFLSYGAEKYWDWYLDEYEKKVKECNRNGSSYIQKIKDDLSDRIPEDLVQIVIDTCNSKFKMSDCKVSINKLRKIFAQISLSKLDPDLVIMDEFQRFRDLIDTEESEAKMLTDKLVLGTEAKVLLLSATPYKPYSTLEEISQDEENEHYREFMKVIDYLFYLNPEKKLKFKSVWKDYSNSLTEIQGSDFTVLIARKNNAENALYDSICRTERFNSGMIDDSQVKEVDIGSGDIQSYIEAKKLLELAGKNVPLDYVKSSPYLFSFSGDYKISEAINKKPIKEKSLDFLKRTKCLFIKKSLINNYKKIDANNARLQKLKDLLFSNEKNNVENLLWVPASKPYYKTTGIFAKNANFSKVLVFSSWKLVPRMISGLISYESERLTVGKLNEIALSKNKSPKRYFADENKKRVVSLRLRNETEEILTFSSTFLAKMYNPIDNFGAEVKDVTAKIEQKILEKINEIKRKFELPSRSGGAKQYLDLIKALENKNYESLVFIPYKAETLLAKIAIASPALCAYRIFKDESQAEAVAKSIVKMFNKPESEAALDVLYGENEDFYYENVLEYCAQGNLQSVLDEFAHVLNETGESLKNAMCDSFIMTASEQIETYESFTKSERQKSHLRTHFAVGYFNTKSTDEGVQRTENIRNAFNSPFRPFVLSTTSVGQEGLDFHLYCRKVIHWNLPSNPIDLEQREGRINRYKCLAIRQNLAEMFNSDEYRETGEMREGGFRFKKNIWDEIFEEAQRKLKVGYSDLVPFWCLPADGNYPIKIERIVPMYPLSKDKVQYKRLIEILSLYRLTLGQPRQEELLELLQRKELKEEELKELFINLCPYDKQRK